MLEVACHRCDRHGRFSLARLIAEHGEGMGPPDLRDVLAGVRTPARRSTKSAAPCRGREPEPADGRGEVFLRSLILEEDHHPLAPVALVPVAYDESLGGRGDID